MSIRHVNVTQVKQQAGPANWRVDAINEDFQSWTLEGSLTEERAEAIAWHFARFAGVQAKKFNRPFTKRKQVKELLG